jgi:hypothetical protein
MVDACALPDRPEIEGNSLVPLVADPSTGWEKATVSTIGRGSHSVATRRWRYIRYFDGSEELYDLQADPEEWVNIAAAAENGDVKLQMAKYIPEDARFKQYVRWGRWKCVIPVEGDPMLFDIQSEFGISEQNDLASDHPDVVEAIQAHLGENELTSRRVNIPLGSRE